jgi:hypothetical protein
MDNPRLIVKVLAEEEAALLDLKPASDESGGEFGTPKRVTDLKPFGFDPAVAIDFAWQVVGVISTIGGAVTFVDWLRARLASGKASALAVKVGDEDPIIIRTADDIQRLEERLKEKLGVTKNVAKPAQG